MRLIRPVIAALVGAIAFAAFHTEPATAQPQSPRAAPVAHDYALAEANATPAARQKLAAMRQVIAARGHKYQVGATGVINIPLAQLAGAKVPAMPADHVQKQVAHAHALLAIEHSARADYLKTHPGVLALDPFIGAEAAGTALDLRRHGKVTPIKSQGACGSCWAFASIAALESSFLMRGDSRALASEQYLLDCAHVGSCTSGDWSGALAFLTTKGTLSESGDPYLMKATTCPSTPPSYQAVAWAPLPSTDSIASADAIKTALRTYGAIVTGVIATDAFQAYRSGVFSEAAVGGSVVTDSAGQRWLNANHAVAIIGFDDSRRAWLIKNSWDTSWGETGGYGSEGGYMWLEYGSSNVGIGAAYIVAKDPRYALGHVFETEVKKFKPPVMQVPTPIPTPHR